MVTLREIQLVNECRKRDLALEEAAGISNTEKQKRDSRAKELGQSHVEALNQKLEANKKLYEKVLRLHPIRFHVQELAFSVKLGINPSINKARTAV